MKNKDKKTVDQISQDYITGLLPHFVLTFINYNRDEQPATVSHATLQRFYILTFKNSTYILRRFFNSINECFISVIFYTRFILLKR